MNPEPRQIPAQRAAARRRNTPNAQQPPRRRPIGPSSSTLHPPESPTLAPLRPKAMRMYYQVKERKHAPPEPPRRRPLQPERPENGRTPDPPTAAVLLTSAQPPSPPNAPRSSDRPWCTPRRPASNANAPALTAKADGQRTARPLAHPEKAHPPHPSADTRPAGTELPTHSPPPTTAPLPPAPSGVVVVIYRSQKGKAHERPNLTAKAPGTQTARALPAKANG